MRLLDIDLDFFLDDICYWTNEKLKRLCDDEYRPWEEYEVINFLESKCGLSKTKKTKGRIVIHHDEAFAFWRTLIKRKELSIPFEVTHIDAHSDLGLDGSWDFVIGYLLHKPAQERTYPENLIEHDSIPDQYSLSEANYLICAIACRWISGIKFVTHPKWKQETNDFEIIHFKDMDINTKCIQLKKYPPGLLYTDIIGKKVSPIEIEPEVGIEIIDSRDYSNDKSFSYITLSCSPKYTPKNSDKLIDIIGQYIEVI